MDLTGLAASIFSLSSQEFLILSVKGHIQRAVALQKKPKTTMYLSPFIKKVRKTTLFKLCSVNADLL